MLTRLSDCGNVSHIWANPMAESISGSVGNLGNPRLDEVGTIRRVGETAVIKLATNIWWYKSLRNDCDIAENKTPPDKSHSSANDISLGGT